MYRLQAQRTRCDNATLSPMVDTKKVRENELLQSCECVAETERCFGWRSARYGEQQDRRELGQVFDGTRKREFRSGIAYMSLIKKSHHRYTT